jgi:hypothetical protein
VNKISGRLSGGIDKITKPGTVNFQQGKRVDKYKKGVRFNRAHLFTKIIINFYFPYTTNW